MYVQTLRLRIGFFIFHHVQHENSQSCPDTEHVFHSFLGYLYVVVGSLLGAAGGWRRIAMPCFTTGKPSKEKR